MENKQRPIEMTELCELDIYDHKNILHEQSAILLQPDYEQMCERFKKTFGGK